MECPGLTGDTVPVLLENSIRLNPLFIIHKLRLNFLKGLGIIWQRIIYFYIFILQNNAKKLEEKANEHFKLNYKKYNSEIIYLKINKNISHS